MQRRTLEYYTLEHTTRLALKLSSRAVHTRESSSSYSVVEQAREFNTRGSSNLYPRVLLLARYLNHVFNNKKTFFLNDCGLQNCMEGNKPTIGLTCTVDILNARLLFASRDVYQKINV